MGYVENLPQVELMVERKNVQFLVDLGASSTLIHPMNVPHIEHSTKSILVQGVSGKPVKESLSEYVTIEDSETGIKATTRVILLGRDLMSAMRMSVHAHDKGFAIQIGQESTSQREETNYYYSLDAYM